MSTLHSVASTSVLGADTRGGVTSSWLWEHKRLAKKIDRLPLQSVQQPQPRDEADAPSRLLLLGIISVSAERRWLLRCTWARQLTAHAVRLRFVLGYNASDANQPDVISVPVEERLLVATANRRSVRRSGGATYSSLSSFLKTRQFFRYASRATEPLVAIADDDVFIQPNMLIAHATLLRDALMNAATGEVAPFVAGALEWYSWREATLVATGWERTAKGAHEKGIVSWRNCTPTGGDAPLSLATSARAKRALSHRPLPLHDRCFGPFPFAKGPLVLLSTPVARWLDSSDLVSRDVQRAAALAAGRLPAYRGTGSGRIPQDVSLGFWLAHHPTLRVVDLQPFTTWCDKWKFVGDLRQLLIAHRVPWKRYAWLAESTRRLWNATGNLAQGKLVCEGPVCEPGQCVSASAQVACRMEVSIPRVTSDKSDYGCFACNCWMTLDGHDRRWQNGTCRFSRTAVPRLPADCWRGHESL